MIFRACCSGVESDCVFRELESLIFSFQKRAIMDVLSIAREKEPHKGAPRCLYIRMSLENARIQQKEICRLASYPDKAEQTQAFAILDSEAPAAPPKEQTPPLWGHQNASYWLLRAGAGMQAFRYSAGELHIAATFCATELQVSRNIQLPELELDTFDLASSANELVTGWWRGRQLGLVKFLASAGKSNGATFTLNRLFR